MLDIVLKILSIIVIILLVLLAVLVVTLLLVLFFPITYKAFGKKNEKDLQAWVKANWLFGLLRVRFFYPKPGKLTVKLLWFTLFDAKSKQEETSKTESAKQNETSEKKSENTSVSSSVQAHKNEVSANPETSESEAQVQTAKQAEAGISNDNTDTAESGKALPVGEDTEKQGKKSIKDRILEKYEKIKYTIRKIYDKIKHILENIAFYKNLLQDEQTKGLLQHAFSRFGRILKSIRPRKLKGDILFGTGSPDTTGYAFGIYGMFIPLYGKHMNVTPDFTQAILEGELYAAGHITIFQLLRHGLMLLLDKRLRLLIHRLKTHTI